MKISFSIVFLLFLFYASQTFAQPYGFGEDSTSYVYHDFTYGGWSVGWTTEGNGATFQDNATGFSNFRSVRLELENSASFLDYHYTVTSKRKMEILNTWLLIPQDTSSLDSISLYSSFEDNDETGVISKSYYPSDLKIGKWNKLSINIPQDVEIISYGIRFSTVANTPKPDFHVDLFTSNPEYIGRASLGIVENLKSDSINTTFTAFSWEPPVGEAPDHYLIQRSKSYLGELSRSDTTSNLSYIDPDVLSSQTYVYRIYAVDSLDRKAPQGQDFVLETPSFEAETTWDFEEESANWEVSSASLFRNIDTLAFSDRKSVKVDTDSSSLESYFLNTSSDINTLIPGQTIFYNIWITEESLEKISALQTYYKHGSNWNWESKWYESDSLIGNKWNKISIQIPNNLPIDSLKEIGIQVVKKEANSTPSFFVDLITTDPNNEGKPTLSAPTNLMISEGFEDINVTWTPSEGTGKKKYQLRISRIIGRPPFFDESFITSDTTFTIRDLKPDTEYDIALTAMDATGKSTESISLKTSTKEYANPIDFDFERGSEGWFDFSKDSPVTVTDFISYSGIYSVKLETPESDQLSYIRLDSIDLEPKQRISFHFLLPTDTSNVRSISIASIFGEKTFFEETMVKDLSPGEWNEIIYRIPDEGEITSLTFNYFSKTTGTPPIYIDLITSDFNPVIRPKISIPDSVTAEPINERVGYKISWKPSFGEDGVMEYRVYRTNVVEGQEEVYELDGTTTGLSFTKIGAGLGIQKIRVASVSLDGRESVTSLPIEIEIGTLISNEVGDDYPTTFKLFYNYPNPFNPSTQIRYDIPETSNVAIRVYDITGRLVQTLVNELKTPGKYNATFQGDNLASGVYFYRIEAGSYTKTHRMLLIK